jgi:hypothetical protein
MSLYLQSLLTVTKIYVSYPVFLSKYSQHVKKKTHHIDMGENTHIRLSIHNTIFIA